MENTKSTNLNTEVNNMSVATLGITQQDVDTDARWSALVKSHTQGQAKARLAPTLGLCIRPSLQPRFMTVES